MQTMIKRQQTQAALTAKAIRKELKQAFPNTKFRVRSQNFSMGDAVDIDWTNGPTDQEVTDVVKKYQYGSFNGMIDMYENTNDRADIPQAKYIQTHREITENHYLDALEHGKGYWSFFNEVTTLDSYIPECQGQVRYFLWKELKDKNLV